MHLQQKTFSKKRSLLSPKFINKVFLNKKKTSYFKLKYSIKHRHSFSQCYISIFCVIFSIKKLETQKKL